jgi:transposase-like protein
MSQKSDRPGTGEQHVRDIRRATRRKWSSEEKIRIVLSGLRGEYSIAELCRREGIADGFTTPDRRNSWKPARSGWQGIRNARHPPAK